MSGSASPIHVYCSMNLACGNQTGVWTRVANIDMMNNSHTCPSEFSLISSPKRLCDNNITGHSGCISNIFSVPDIQYSRVCGKIIGYQHNSLTAFFHGSCGIDGQYVHGVSLTHGQNPRKHIWTFARASDETPKDPWFKCPCLYTTQIDSLAQNNSRAPSVVGNDYFCETSFKFHFGDFPLEWKRVSSSHYNMLLLQQPSVVCQGPSFPYYWRYRDEAVSCQQRFYPHWNSGALCAMNMCIMNWFGCMNVLLLILHV